MSTVAIRLLRTVLVLAFAGAVFVQVMIVPLLGKDLEGAPTAPRIVIPTVFALGLVALEVVAVCIWKLLTMVRRGTVFSPDAFRWVDIIIGSIAFGSLMVFAFGVAVAPGEDIAPGLVLMIGGVALVIAGVALIVIVLRFLLMQAVALDHTATTLRAELNEVI
jgi:hypothetical protein